MELIVRNARPDDAAAILSILNPIIVAGRQTVFDGPFTEEAERRYIAELPPRGIFHVAVLPAGDRIVGFQSMEPFATYTATYRSQGFRVVGVAERQAKIGEQFIDEVLVERLL